MLFTDEVKNIDELLEKLSELDIELDDNIKVAVVCFTFDSDGKLILQRRGEGARDDVGKLCAIGGSANFSDPDFRSSLMREIREEGGSEAEIQIDGFIGALEKHSYDKNAGVYNQWVILAYHGKLIKGDFVNTEPERCLGFVREYIEDFDEDELVHTAKVVISHMKKNKN